MEDLSHSSLVAVFALIVAFGSLAMKMFDKSLSLREHNEFKENMRHQLELITRRQEERLIIREFRDWMEQVRRDLDRLEEDLRAVDQIKPTTGELELASKAIEARLRVLELQLQELQRPNSPKDAGN